MLSEVSGKLMHQAYRQWGIAHGNDTTPVEVDALMKGKGKREGQRERQRERQSKVERQAEGRNIRHVEYEAFLLQGERATPERIAQSSRLGSLRREQ